LDLVIAVDDPRADDVRALLETHLAFAREVTPPGHVHALGVDELADPDVTFFSVRFAGDLLAIGALRRLDGTHAELKSMHVTTRVRSRGIGRALVEHLVTVAAQQGYRRVSLETGTMDAFAPARALYAAQGFVPCAPFAGYTDNPHSTCMTLELGPENPPGPTT
jgi:putative acetyltransferase